MSHALHPSVIWAQRKNCVFLTICLDDCKDPDIKMESSSVTFKGKGGSEQKEHEALIELFGPVDAEASKYWVRPRNIEFLLKKADGEDNFWPRLTKSSAKVPWVKVDFDKWHDEDESDEEMPGGGGGGGMGGMGMPGGGDGTDFEEMMRQMGGLGGMGGGGGGGLGGLDKPNLDDLDNNETDSDDENLPDLE